MSKYGFNIFWSEDDQAFVATCPNFPGLSAFGATLQEALSEGEQVLSAFDESMKNSGTALPAVTTMAEFQQKSESGVDKSMPEIERKIALAIRLIGEAIAEDAQYCSPAPEQIKRICKDQICVGRVDDPVELIYRNKGTKFTKGYTGPTRRVLYEFNFKGLEVIAVTERQ